MRQSDSIKPESIKKLVEMYSGVDDISVKNRDRYLNDCRVVHCVLCKAFCQEKTTLASIGGPIKRDHTTVLHALRRSYELLGKSTFTANKVYESAKKYLEEENDYVEIENALVKNGNVNRIMQYWRNRFWKYKEKYHGVINNQKKTIKLIEDRFGIFPDEISEQIKELSDAEYDEFIERNRTFIRVRKKLNRK